MTSSAIKGMAHKQAMVCYWPTVLMCLPDCDFSVFSSALPGLRKELGVSAWPAPCHAVGCNVFIDITHWQAPLGGAFAAAWALLDALKQSIPGRAWRAGIAPGMASSRFAAQAAEHGALIDVPAWNMMDVLAYVPLTDYIDGIPSRVSKRLQQDGIRTFEDVLQFTAGDWHRCYGNMAVSIRRACLGLDHMDDAVSANSNVFARYLGRFDSWQELGSSLVLPVNASSHRALRSYLRVLCVRLSRELRRCSQRTGRVELELWSVGSRPVWAYGAGLGTPDNEAGKLFTVLQGGLKHSADNGPVLKMRITASQLSHEAGQLDLLDQILAGQNTQNSTTPRISR